MCYSVMYECYRGETGITDDTVWQFRVDYFLGGDMTIYRAL